ncbi:hypothetical protein, partial [Streptomyces sp. BE230]|uniref:hypothetical protein n=1 Tax=Streptomyces sp. BE230 TaxID=3002526 RepID=UPI002ED496CA|nr:hypothetical protein [Streptomyces sp. BE230]
MEGLLSMTAGGVRALAVTRQGLPPGTELIIVGARQDVLGVLCSCRVLGEGVDIRGKRGVGGVVFADTRSSPVDIVQITGREPEPAAGTPLQYADYTLWQHAALGDGIAPQSVLRRQLDHWHT